MLVEWSKLAGGIGLAVCFLVAAYFALAELSRQQDETFHDRPHHAALRQAEKNKSAASLRLREKCPITPKGYIAYPQGSYHQQVLRQLLYDVTTHIKYLDCAMREERQRLCDAKERQELVSNLHGYSNLVIEIEDWKKIPPSRFDNVLNKFTEPDKKIVATAPRLDDWVEKGLNDLILAGYIIPKRDFKGWFGLNVPKVLRGKLIEPFRGRNPCK